MILALALAALTLIQTPAETPKPEPAKQTEPAKPKTAFEELTPASQKVVKEHAKYFIVTKDGKFWDRQLWLKREELRDKARRANATRKVKSDMDHALGVSADAPVDPLSLTGGIYYNFSDRFNETKPTAQHTSNFGFGKDKTNPPMLRAINNELAITNDAIHEALRSGAYQTDDDAVRTPKTITPEELAQALKDGKAELSEFRFTKKEVTKEVTKTVPGDYVGQPTKQITVNQPLYTEFNWVRNPVAVKRDATKEKPKKP